MSTQTIFFSWRNKKNNKIKSVAYLELWQGINISSYMVRLFPPLIQQEVGGAYCFWVNGPLILILSARYLNNYSN